MADKNKDSQDEENIVQGMLFGLPEKIVPSKRKAAATGPMKLILEASVKARLQQGSDKQPFAVVSIPSFVLPNRWEYLQPKIEGQKVSVRTVIRPVERAMIVIRNIISYLETTGGTQVLIIRADSGSGKLHF